MPKQRQNRNHSGNQNGNQREQEGTRWNQMERVLTFVGRGGCGVVNLITDKKSHVPNAAQQLGQDDARSVVVGVFAYFVVQHRHFPLHAVQQLLQHGRGQA